MNLPVLPTKPCPTCGAELYEPVVTAYRHLYSDQATLVDLQGLGRAIERTLRRVDFPEEEAFDRGFADWAGATIFDFLDAVRHRLDEQP